MKYLILSVAATAAAVYLTQSNTKASTSFLQEQDEVSEAFVKFMARFSKSYSTLKEAQQRYKTFRANHSRVQAHNSRSRGFKLGLNRFSDMSEEEFLEVYGKGLSSKPILGSDHPWDDHAEYDD